jgi:hypothetical protein
MSHVTGFAHDVFVSYSTVDNDVLVADGRGWVDMLLDKLRRELKPRLGGRDLKMFVDHEAMRSSLSLTFQLIDAVRSSATLLVVMSPSYLRSPWCDRERRAFLDAVRDRAAGSMIVVRARPVDRGRQPEEFRDLRGIDFFTAMEGVAAHRLLGTPDPNERPFIERIVTLSGELAEQLDRAEQLNRASVVPRAGKRVFVAEATDDLEDRESELRSYLDQAGLEVLPSPQSRYPTTDLAAYEAAVVRELDSCCLFTQVLSVVHGRDLPFAPGHRLPALQHALARRAGKTVLQWRDRTQPIDAVRDLEHKSLLESAQACGIEEFKRTVAEAALRPPAEPPRPPPPQVAIFINADARDHVLAVEISDALANLGVDCYRMPATGSPSDIRIALENNLRGCDGLVLVYGKTEFYWVQEQLRQARKLNSTRDTPLSTMAVFEGPPPEKPDIPVTIKNLDVLNCRQGINPKELQRFVEQLRR